MAHHLDRELWLPRGVRFGSGHWARFDAGPLATRAEPKAAWTGQEMLVVGGLAVERYAAFADGAAYTPGTGEWRSIPRRPDHGRILAAAWTGTELFVIGQVDGIGLDDARSIHLYDPIGDLWRSASPPSRGFSTPAVFWTGSEVLVWDGRGVLYDPATDTWRDTAPPDSCGVVGGGRVLWLGGASLLSLQAAVVPESGGQLQDCLLLFDPAEDSWRVAAALPAPIQFFAGAGAAWFGAELLLDPSTVTEGDGFIYAYDPRSDSWRVFPAPTTSRDEGTALFTGVAIDHGRGVIRIGSSARPLLLFDPRLPSWTHSGAPDGQLPADGIILWTGETVLLWGRPADASPSANAAWKWTPPAP